jgi:hypothetical protein
MMVATNTKELCMQKFCDTNLMFYLLAVIPVTGSDHELLPVQFSVDPGELFVWGRDENNPHLDRKSVV